MRALRLLLVALALVLFGMATTADAAPSFASAIVRIQGFTYIPPTVTINVGESVTWTNLDNTQHSARATGGSFDTGALSQGGTKTVLFPVAGSFPYICGIHGSSMTGTVVVSSPATPAPTPVPTPVPTVRTAQPTPVPTAQPTESPSPQPSAVTTTAPATTAAATAAPVAAASSAATPQAGGVPGTAVTTNDSGPGPLIALGAVAIIVGLCGLAWVLLRR